MRAPASSRRRRSSGGSSPVLPACSSVPPLVLGRCLERGEGLIPELVEVGAEAGQAVRIDAVDPPRAVSTLGHQPGFFQNPQMLRDRGATDGQLVGDLPDRAGALPELLENRPPGAVTECIHRVWVSHDLRKSTLTKAWSQVPVWQRARTARNLPRGRGLRGERVTPLSSSEARHRGRSAKASPYRVILNGEIAARARRASALARGALVCRRARGT